MSLSLTRNPNPQSMANDGAPVEGMAGGPAVADINARAPHPLDSDCWEDLLQRFMGWYKIDRDHWAEWRQEAAECYDYRAGHQWAEEDLQILADQLRPAITFNRIGPFIDAVGGLEINNRQETSYVPRQIGSTGVNDLLTAAAQWVRQECDAEDEETEAFLDVVTCGIGCTQSRMDYDDEPDGMARVDRIDPLCAYPDSGAKKQNFADGRRVMVVSDIPIDAALDMFPDVAEEDLDAQWARDQPDETRTPHNARLAPFYRIDQSGDVDRDTKLVRLVEVEWWQFEPSWRVLDPASGRFVMLSDEKANRYAIACRLAGVRPTMLRDKRKRYYKAICGNRILKVMKGAEVGGFSYKFITGKRDQIKGTWYGLVRAMRDPQMWANKWMSQGLHILNTNAKGGLMAETDAFVDIDEARDNWASADSITELNPGGLSKVKEKAPPPFPPQLNNMLEMAQQAFPMVSGVNMEMMGQSTSTAPQVALLEAGRKQQGMNVLAALFNAKRRYQKEQGRLLLWMIQTYIADGRLIRIGGPENARYVALVHEPGLAEYDVIVEDAPTSTNMKERVWLALMQMFPMLRGMQIPPQFYINALKYAPVPESFVTESQQILSQPAPANPTIEGKAAVEHARAGLLGAQTQKVAAEIASFGQETDLDREQKEATIEKTRADAINALQNAGIIEDDQRFQQTMKAIDALLSVHGAALAHQDQQHRHTMERAEHDLARTSATHGATMDMAGHSLAEEQAEDARQQAARQQTQGE